MAVGAIMATSGCSTRTFRVDAIKDPEIQARGEAYVIANANPERDDADPVVRTAAAYVKTALSSKGLYEAPEGVSPATVVEVDFGAEAPKRELVRALEPVYRTVREPGAYVTESYVDDQGNTRTVTRYVPGMARTVMAGWREVRYESITHPKYLRITAREVPAEGDDRPPRELWSVYVTHDDTDAGIAASLPYLVAAAMDAIDQNASSQRTVTLRDKDERVAFIRRGI